MGIARLVQDYPIQVFGGMAALAVLLGWWMSRPTSGFRRLVDSLFRTPRS